MSENNSKPAATQWLRLGPFGGSTRTVGLLMVYASLLPIMYMMIRYEVFISPIQGAIKQGSSNIDHFDILITTLFPIALLVFSAMTFFLGYRLVVASGVTADYVLPIQDKELLAGLVSDGNEQGVRLYLDLTNVKGATGTFTKLGITGLPLATIFLTCFFAFLGSFASSNGATFLDLAKLTLGAFIGSFVQRQTDRDRRARQDPPVNPTKGPVVPP